MTISNRAYSNEGDAALMIALANQFPADHLHVTDLPYRLSSWAFDQPENIHLWFDENQALIAWVALQTPFWTVDIVCRPQSGPALYAGVIDWADQRARDALHTAYERPAWYVNVFSGQEDRIQQLEKAGFRCQSNVGEDSWSKVLMRRSGETPVKLYAPPAGFTVRQLAGEDEAESYAELHQSVFESKNMTAAWRKRTLQQPAYRPDLDMVVAAPDGRLAAFCICWLNGNGINGQVEPLGCHKDFRRYALGRMALSAGLRRLQALGVKNIFVETDNDRSTALRLYRSFDFQVIQDVLVYRKDYAGT